MSFKNFRVHHLVQEGIDAQGFTEPTPVQARVIPEALEGRDVRACAQTGTGKTVAFVIPILNQILNQPSIQALVIVPTRELGAQVFKVFNQLGKNIHLKSVLLLGGMKIGKQIRQIRQGVEVIVATPGRLKDHLERKSLSLENVKTLVLDEADRMLDMGFLPDIKKILSYLRGPRQTLFFSATFPPQIQHLTDQFLTNPVTVDLAPSTPPNTVTQSLFPVSHAQKDTLLQTLLGNGNTGSTLIFCRTKRRVNRLTITLKKMGKSADCLHSNKSQSQRTRVIHAFSHKQIQMLVATDIASRGLDMKDVTHVINYDVPGHPEDYVHRIGRTGRAKATGDAFTLVSPDEEKQITAIERFIKKSIPRTVLPDFDYQHQPRQHHQPHAHAGHQPQTHHRPPGSAQTPPAVLEEAFKTPPTPTPSALN